MKGIVTEGTFKDIPDWFRKWLRDKQRVQDTNLEEINKVVEQYNKNQDLITQAETELAETCRRYDELVSRIAIEQRQKDNETTHRRLETDV